MGTLSEIPPVALDAWHDLVAALAEVKTPTPCQRPSQGQQWFAKRRADRRIAAESCRVACPLLDVCRTYADAAHVQWGVWGGRDYEGAER